MIRKTRILVVDDEFRLAQFMKVSLERTSIYEVRIETNPKQALETAREFKPDLVFMDISMPHIDGSEVAAQFMQDNFLKNVPIVFLTGAVSKEEVGPQGGMIGGRSFLAKPVTTVDLMTVIGRHLNPSSHA